MNGIDENAGISGDSKFERWRGTVGLFLGPLVGLLILALPIPSVSTEAHRLMAVFAFVIVFWLSEAIPLPATALLGVCLAVMLGVAPMKDALTAFGDPVIFLFIGSFIIARAMQVNGLDKRIAYSLLSRRWVAGSTYRTIWALGLTTFFLSMWMSNTACTAMLFPVAVAMARATAELIRPGMNIGNDAPRLRYTTGLLLMLTFAASIGGMATPVGTPPNLIGLGLIEKATQVHVGFLQWMMFALPMSFLLFVAAYFIIILLFRPEAKRVEGQWEMARKSRDALGPWTAGERNSLIAFGVAVVLWLTPGFFGLVCGDDDPRAKWLVARLPEGIVALLAASLLFLLPTNWRKREFTLKWEDAARIDWGTVLLFGGGIALGKMMFDTGVASFVGKGMLEALGVKTSAGLSGAAAVTGTAVTELCSNVASANMVVPVVISMANAAHLPALAAGLAATLSVSLGFGLPISTAPNAIVYGSRAIKLTDMLKAGLLLDVVGALLVWAVATWLIPLVVGL